MRKKLMRHLLFVVAGFLTACNNHRPVEENVAAPTDSLQVAADTLKTEDHFPDLSEKTHLGFPFAIDNENYYEQYHADRGDSLTQEQFDAMQLDTLEDCQIRYGCNFYVLHIVPFSDHYNSYLIYRDSGSEWKMWLTNYSTDHVYLDHLQILYGDAVEYYFEIFSHVSANEIEVTEIRYDYSGETETSVKEVVLYTIDDSGHFIKTNLLERSEDRTAGF